MNARWIGVALAATTLAGCASLLGDFTVGDASTDATAEVGADGAGDVTVDVGSDVHDAQIEAEAEAAVTCGLIGLACCTSGQQCQMGACCAATCVDLVNDDKNCNVCGHSCLGSKCATSQCQPQQLATVSDTQPGRVRVDTTNAYFVTTNGAHNGSLYSCAQAGCTSPTTLLSGLYYAYDMVLDDNYANVFVADDTTSPLLECATSGCSKTATKISLTGGHQFNGLDYRSNVFASYNVQPHEFKADGTGDLDLGSGNEGTNTIVAPPGTTYVYWDRLNTIRVGKDNTTTYGDFATLGSGENALYIAANKSYVAFTGDPGTGINIYACAIGSSCASPTKLSSGERLNYVEGNLAIGPDDFVYWIGTDSSASHVNVRGCPATGCTSVTSVATVATTAFKAVSGGVTADKTFVYFTLEDNGTTYLYRVAK